MTFRIGAVGVGPWSQKLATAFRECGAEIVAFDRKGAPNERGANEIRLADGFGEFRRWQEQLSDGKIDALIICAPPDVTTEVALECAKAGKRCVATKPLMWTEVPAHTYWNVQDPDDGLSRSLYVDLWRLYSPAWLAMKEELRGKKIDRIDVAFCGNGPFRSFNGALDYGPHALAFVFDLLGTTDVCGLEPVELEPEDEKRQGKLYSVTMRVGGVPIEMKIGNGADEPERSVYVYTGEATVRKRANEYRFDEPANGHPGEKNDRFLCRGFDELQHHKDLALRRFCRAFMAGDRSRTLEYSIAGQRVLERIVGQ